MVNNIGVRFHASISPPALLFAATMRHWGNVFGGGIYSHYLRHTRGISNVFMHRSEQELLDLGERIGHVNTGLGEEQIGKCLRKTVLSVVDELSSHSYLPEVEPKCSICQEEYEADDEMGKLECGHAYHLHCIKQWLTRKNTCPVCKAEASSL